VIDDEDLAGITTLIQSGSPFARTLAPSVISVTDDEVELRADVPPTLYNHIGGPHAAALFGVAETAAAGVVLTVFEDLVAIGAIPMIKSAEIVYNQITHGTVTTRARFTGDAEGVRASYELRGVAVFPVEVTISGQDGKQTARLLAQMALKRL
jgi:acyl-coenzyme A thioesterase PaaI-like protein